MKQELIKALKIGFWGAVVGAALTMVIGFRWGGWTTSSTTQKMANDAVLQTEAAMCAARFMAQPDHAAELAKFNKTDSWSRSDFIDKGGWDKLPGEEKSAQDIAQACTDRLNALAKN